MRTTTRNHERRRGGTLLEFVMLLPMFLFLVLFLLDSARLLMISGAMSDATYRSARAGAVSGGASYGDSSRVAFDQALDEIPGADVADDPTLTVTRGSVCSNAQPYVEVTSSYTVPLITPGLGGLLELATGDGASDTWLAAGEFEMTSTAVARCEVAP